MSTKTTYYATSPVDTHFIKANKKYPIKTMRDSGFSIDKDLLEVESLGDLHCLKVGCTHLKGKNWKITE